VWSKGPVSAEVDGDRVQSFSLVLPAERTIVRAAGFGFRACVEMANDTTVASVNRFPARASWVASRALASFRIARPRASDYFGRAQLTARGDGGSPQRRPRLALASLGFKGVPPPPWTSARYIFAVNRQRVADRKELMIASDVVISLE
jgi:hypothetical protein